MRPVYGVIYRNVTMVTYPPVYEIAFVMKMDLNNKEDITYFDHKYSEISQTNLTDNFSVCFYLREVNNPFRKWVEDNIQKSIASGQQPPQSTTMENVTSPYEVDYNDDDSWK